MGNIIDSAVVHSNATVTADVTGTTYEMKYAGETPPDGRKFWLVGRCILTGGTSPTLAAYAELSSDKVHWSRVTIGTALTAAGTMFIAIEAAVVTRYVRIYLDLGGTALGSVDSHIELGSNAPFTATAVA